MATNKIQVGLRLNATLHEKIRFLSTKEQRSLNNMMEYALQRYIDEYERENGEIPLPEDFIGG